MPTVGLFQASASAFAMLAPTSSAPARPGLRERDRVDVVAARAALRHHFLEQRQRAADGRAMRAGHDAAVFAVHGDLRVERVREQPRCVS